MPSRANRAKSTASSRAGHAAGLVPQAPAQRDRRQAMRPAMHCQRVQEAVGRRVVGLTRRAHQTRPSTRTAQTPTDRNRGSAHAGSTPHPPWPATPHPPAPASTTSPPHRRARRRRESPPKADAAPGCRRSPWPALHDPPHHRPPPTPRPRPACNSATNSAAPGASRPRRPTSTRLRTPWLATTWRANAEPAIPVPPVTTTVPAAHASGMRQHDLAGMARLTQIPQRRAARDARRTQSPATAAAWRRRTSRPDR